MSESHSIDLHGCTVAEAMSRFVSFYNGCLREGYRGFIEVVHGYGSTNGQGGAIKKELHRYLKAHADRLEMFVAGDSLGNPGMTKVYGRKLLTERQDRSGEWSPERAAILRFCEVPRSRERVFSKLTGRFGDRALREEMARMMREGLLKEQAGKVERG